MRRLAISRAGRAMPDDRREGKAATADRRAASMMKTTSAAVLANLLLLSNSYAQQQFRLPTDVELKAGYCVTVTNAAIALGEQAVANTTDQDLRRSMDRTFKDARDRQARLRAYLEPRMASMEIDLAPLLAAMKRGEIDAATLQREMWNTLDRCTPTCPPMASQQGAECVTACWFRDPLTQRVQSCAKLDWLPF